jgi:predicted HTH domain antitoxin
MPLNRASPVHRIINKVAMQIKLELPDEIASQFGASHELSRAALEGLVTEGCRTHRLSDHQAAKLLGLSRYELDGFLKAHGVYLDYSLEDLDREAGMGERLWQKRSPDPSGR